MKTTYLRMVLGQKLHCYNLVPGWQFSGGLIVKSANRLGMKKITWSFFSIILSHTMQTGGWVGEAGLKGPESQYYRTGKDKKICSRVIESVPRKNSGR